MASALSVNPMQTTNARGTFYAKSDGLIQGVALDDPAARYALASGTLGSDEINLCGADCRLTNWYRAPLLHHVAALSNVQPAFHNWWAFPCSTRHTTA
ncbi:Uncharacterised protein [Salmonella enterica subsp. arizonae]|uniref:Uncharacterized protein n=1 Tax=Salmonella enterica subsp. arizonae TaxID=59203 RepID=A0A379S3G5_SALER|nr:Uncharacterised protein [Salmonella enterica subsp. arizonae]